MRQCLRSVGEVPSTKPLWLLLGSRSALERLEAARGDARCRCAELDTEEEEPLPEGLNTESLDEQAWSTAVWAVAGLGRAAFKVDLLPAISAKYISSYM